jgi:MFS family permease
MTAAILPITVYVLGLGFGPIISAPLSETFGRRAVYFITFPPFLLFTLGAGFAHSFAALLVCRLLAGTIGSACLAVGAGTNSDMYSPLDRAVSSAIFLLAPFLGPAIGPPVGGFAAQGKGWRWTQWPILFIGLVSLIFSIPQSETYKKIILQHRAKKLGLAPPSHPIPTGPARLKFLLLVTLGRPLRMLVTEPIVAFFSLYTAFNFAVLFGFFAAFPYVFRGVYHFNLGETGLTFLGIGIGCLLASLSYIVTDRLTYRKWTLAAQAKGDMTPLAPEHRLYGAMIGSFMLPLGLFWFAWTARPGIHWIVPIIATVPFACGNLLVFNSAVLYLLDTYGPLMGASAMAANGLLRYTLGAVFPLFTVQMYRKLGIGWATSLLGFVTVGLLPIPWVLWKYGRQIRTKSAYL